MAARKPKLAHGPYSLMHVIWQDALVDNGWADTSVKIVPATIISVGWQIDETDKTIVLASDIGDSMDPTTQVTTTETNRRIAIPKDWVISQKELK